MGLPGSGKSTFAKTMWSEFVICEADQYFVGEDGVYRFDVSKLKDAHKWCRDKVETFMKDNQVNSQFYREIVVSNTFTQDWEMEQYFKMAETYNYRVHTVIVENRHGSENVHNVPENKLQQMKERFQIKL